jgi:hypothetical protein
VQGGGLAMFECGGRIHEGGHRIHGVLQMGA